MRTPNCVRVARVLLPVLCVPLFTLLLVACVISPISPNAPAALNSPLPTPVALVVLDPETIVSNAAPMAYAPGTEVLPEVEGVNPAFVGIYQSDVITWTGAFPGTGMMTFTLSLFADGTYDQMEEFARDMNTYIEQDFSLFMSGHWSVPGDAGTLRPEWGFEGTFFAIGADALTIAFPPNPLYNWPEAWVVTKVSAVPEPLFARSVKTALQEALPEGGLTIAPGLVGHYAATPQFVSETGVVAPTLTLFANGWAEYSINLVSEPNAYALEWGIWSVTADPEPVVTVLLTNPNTGGLALSSQRSYVWDGDVLVFQGEPTQSAYTLPLARTDEVPSSRMESVYNILFPR